MNTTTKLSVSSAILAAVLSGCSQQQVIGGSQVVGSPLSGGSQVAGSQKQIEGAVPVVTPRVATPRVVKKAPVRVTKPRPVRVVKRGLGLPQAKPGQCFAKVKVPATYQTKSRRILVQKATSTRKLVRAPQYRWVNKKVMVRKPTYRTRVLPAQYKTVNNRVLVKPAYNTWKPGHGAITRIDNMTGQIMCRVTVPAVYKNVQRKVMVRQAQKVRTLIPAAYKTVKQKQFVAPAQYRTVKTPARYKTQNYRVQTRSSRYVWRPVLCKTNAPKHAYKHHKKAPAKQYRKAIVRTAPKKQYKRKATNNQGINYQDYLKVMRAGTKTSTGKAKIKRTRAKTQSAVISTEDYLKVMRASAGTAKLNPAKKTNKKVVLKKRTTKAAKPIAKKPAKMKAPAKAKVKKPIVKKNAPTETKASSKKSIVFGIQKALKAKGFDPGSMDGKMGPGTAAALKAFQSSRGLPIGQLSKDTFRALGLIR